MGAQHAAAPLCGEREGNTGRAPLHLHSCPRRALGMGDPPAQPMAHTQGSWLLGSRPHQPLLAQLSFLTWATLALLVLPLQGAKADRIPNSWASGCTHSLRLQVLRQGGAWLQGHGHSGTAPRLACCPLQDHPALQRPEPVREPGPEHQSSDIPASGCSSRGESHSPQGVLPVLSGHLASHQGHCHLLCIKASCGRGSYGCFAAMAVSLGNASRPHSGAQMPTPARCVKGTGDMQGQVTTSFCTQGRQPGWEQGDLHFRPPSFPAACVVFAELLHLGAYQFAKDPFSADIVQV